MKHLFVSISVKQNLFVSVIVHKCLMILNDVEYTTFKMFVTQMSNYVKINSECSEVFFFQNSGPQGVYQAYPIALLFRTKTLLPL